MGGQNEGNVMKPNTLSDEQKDLLRLIVAGLKNRRKHEEPWWIRMAHDHSMPVWQNVKNPRLWRELQEKTDLSAMLVLEGLGLITSTQPGRYTLDEPRITAAVEKGFFEDSEASGAR
jgi:hypothetical protein